MLGHETLETKRKLRSHNLPWFLESVHMRTATNQLFPLARHSKGIRKIPIEPLYRTFTSWTQHTVSWPCTSIPFNHMFHIIISIPWTWSRNIVSVILLLVPPTSPVSYKIRYVVKKVPQHSHERGIKGQESLIRWVKRQTQVYSHSQWLNI